MSTLKTGKVKTTTIADELDTESTAVTNVINGSAKAWVNFNGSGTVAIRRAFNVSSITDNGTGNYTVNFTTAMPDINYSYAVNGWKTGSYSPHADIYFGGSGYSTYVTTSSIQVGYAGTSGFTVSDPLVMSVAVFS